MRLISDYPLPSSKWRALLQRPLIWILLVGLLAMGGALRADFYMDDFNFIQKADGLSPAEFRLLFMGYSFGSTAADAQVVTIFQTIPTLITMVTNSLFPMNPMAAHCWNLGIHLTLSVFVFRLGERLLRRLQLLSSAEARRSAAVVGALVFACHPLGTEPVHYAKCHMVQLVALFGFWATCEALDFFAAPTRQRGLRLLLAGGLCVLSYFPGTVMLGINIGILIIFTLNGTGRDHLNRFFPSWATLRRPRNLVILALVIIPAAGVVYYFLRTFYGTYSNWGYYATLHVPTQGRVFWEYVQRIFIPVHLSSDHYQPWSSFRDPESVLKLAGFLLLVTLSAVMTFRQGTSARRGYSLLLLLALVPFAMRMLYINIEIMVEYRAYNALPWISLLAGCGFSALAARLAQSRLRWMPAAALIAVFTLLSAERGRVWSSAISLAENSLQQYPLNNRARDQLEMWDLYSGEYGKVLARHEEVKEAYDKIMAANLIHGDKVLIDPVRAKSNLLYSLQYVIHAKGQLEGFVNALAFADHSITSLKANLPAAFEVGTGQSLCPAWPVLRARDAMAKASANQSSPESKVTPAQKPQG